MRPCSQIRVWTVRADLCSVSRNVVAVKSQVWMWNFQSVGPFVVTKRSGYKSVVCRVTIKYLVRSLDMWKGLICIERSQLRRRGDSKAGPEQAEDIMHPIVIGIRLFQGEAAGENSIRATFLSPLMDGWMDESIKLSYRDCVTNEQSAGESRLFFQSACLLVIRHCALKWSKYKTQQTESSSTLIKKTKN